MLFSFSTIVRRANETPVRRRRCRTVSVEPAHQAFRTEARALWRATSKGDRLRMREQTGQPDSTSPVGSISRRSLLRAGGAGAAVMGAGGLLEACSSSIKGASSGSGGTKHITIGWIHPLAGSLARVGAAGHR